MQTSLISFRDSLLELTLDFLWRQWSSLGVAGRVNGGGDAIIDPEALLLATTGFARHDPRLFDEVLDWLDAHGSLINLQRLQNMAGRLGERTVLQGMAEHLAKRTANAKWRSLLREAAPAREAGLLFPESPVFGEADELFARRGWRRGPVKLRRLGRPPDPHLPANLLIKLRSLFGMQARAEVMAYLLAFASGHPAEMAERLGYFPRTLQTTLNDMARSGHVMAGREGQEKRFWLRREEWRFLIARTEGEGGFPRWVDWAPRFAALEGVWRFLNRTDLHGAAPGVQAMELRACVGQMAPAFVRENIRSAPDAAAGAFVESVLDDFRRLIERVDKDSTIGRRVEKDQALMAGFADDGEGAAGKKGE